MLNKQFLNKKKIMIINVSLLKDLVVYDSNDD